uniref:Putative RNA-directed DNA polymerase from transposon BS n=1 Tax=Lygus hesperus TaxID=30085 RepID=A0A0A9Y5J8_LYGHE
MVTIIQWNARSIFSNAAAFEQLLACENADMALISETCLHPTRAFRLSGYELVRCDRNQSTGGCAIAIKNPIPYTVIDTAIPERWKQLIQLVAIKVVIKNQPLHVASIYFSPNFPRGMNDWEGILTQLPHPLLLGGDFNAHNLSFGGLYTDNRGRKLADVQDIMGLSALNDGTHTYIPRPNQRSSALDITFVTAVWAPECYWEVLENPCGSDHCPIKVDIKKSDSTPSAVQVGGWNIKRADWDKYQSAMINQLEDFNTETNSLPYHEFTEIINKAADESIPRKYANFNVHRNRRQRPWWDLECNGANLEYLGKFRHYRYGGNFATFLSMSQSQAVCRRLFKRKKKENWKTYCENLNRTTPMTEVWRKVRSIKRGIEIKKRSTSE